MYDYWWPPISQKAPLKIRLYSQFQDQTKRGKRLSPLVTRLMTREGGFLILPCPLVVRQHKTRRAHHPQSHLEERVIPFTHGSQLKEMESVLSWVNFVYLQLLNLQINHLNDYNIHPNNNLKPYIQ
ncbi:hypothetical protein J6590_040659 [Homalodisca vitripennis]|nr:hypothetical protein J6590_040659 [Homalodisca vitripennis]